METDSVYSQTPRVAEELVPTVIAKKRQRPADALPAGLGSGSSARDERNAAEIARLSAWATGECGNPILAD